MEAYGASRALRFRGLVAGLLLVLLAACGRMVPPTMPPPPSDTAKGVGVFRGPEIGALRIASDDAAAALASFRESCPRLLARTDASPTKCAIALTPSLDARGQVDPDPNIVREGAAISPRSKCSRRDTPSFESYQKTAAQTQVCAIGTSLPVGECYPMPGSCGILSALDARGYGEGTSRPLSRASLIHASIAYSA